MIQRPDADLDISLLRDEVARRFDLGAVADCVLLDPSFNTNYRLDTAAGRFVLRLSGRRSRPAAGIPYEIELLRHLDSRGIPVAVPVPTREGDFVWNVAAPEGERTAVLFTFAQGEHAVNPCPSAALGRTAADLHEALDDFAGPPAQTGLDWRYLVEEPLAAVQSFVQHRTDIGDYLERVAAALRSRLDEIAADLDVGACHGDLHPRNANLAADGTITLFDFEDCGPGWRAYELAVFRWWQHFTRQPVEYWTTYLSAYQQRRRLGPANLAAVPLFVAVRHIRLLGAGVWGAGIGGWWPDDPHFERRLSGLSDWIDQNPGLVSPASNSWSWPASDSGG